MRHLPWQESDRIGTGVPQSDSKLGAVVSRRESLGQRAREKGLGKNPVMYEREEDTGVPLRDATCFDLKVRVVPFTIAPCFSNFLCKRAEFWFVPPSCFVGSAAGEPKVRHVCRVSLFYRLFLGRRWVAY